MLVNNDISGFSYELNIVIVRHGLGSKIVHYAKECGISGGTIVLGKGTAKSSLLKFLELSESTKEVVMVLSDKTLGNKFLKKVFIEMNLDKPNHGIAFSIPICNVMGTQGCSGDESEKPGSEGEEMYLYNSIFVIVDKGNGNKVVEVASEAGARGGTIINARGSGTHETSKIFAIEIEPEKEIVLILVESKKVKKICKKIMEKVGLDKAGKGIMFVQNVSQVYGIS